MSDQYIVPALGQESPLQFEKFLFAISNQNLHSHILSLVSQGSKLRTRAINEQKLSRSEVGLDIARKTILDMGDSTIHSW